MVAGHRHVALVVDDNDEYRSVIETYLVTVDVDVRGAASGVAALAVLRGGHRPCAVIVDVDLPGMDGWALVERLRADPLLADLAIIMHSGLPADATRAGALGVRSYLVKPLQPQRIVDAIHQRCPLTS